jgi:hypothetical protein
MLPTLADNPPVAPDNRVPRPAWFLQSDAPPDGGLML